jgi:glycosyltransferase involved in cell wall biosynthesis
MSEYKISYILTTYNKLPYLQQVLGRLVAARLADEEIVVCDGGSTDGTAEYLRGLFEAGSIQQFVSERDKGEAHGFNKGMLMAKGEVIKIITDDDAFYYPVIRQAADFMVKTPTVDAMIGYTAGTEVNKLDSAYILHGPRRQYEQWLADQTPFWMVGLTIMIRRTSLPLTGLFFTGIVLVDMEFMLRITSINVNLAWCTGVMSMHVGNPNGNYNRMKPSAIKAEGLRAHNYYVVPKLAKRDSAAVLRDTLESIKRPFRPIKRAIFDQFGIKQIVHSQSLSTGYKPLPGEDPMAAVYRTCDEFLAAHNANQKTEFLCRDQVQVDKVLHAS